MVSEYRPFGWSRDGKFAFMAVREMAGRGGIVFTYAVIDAVTDETVSTIEDDSFDWTNGRDPTVEYS